MGNAHLVDGKYAIGHLVDLEHLRRVFERFTEATGFTIGFLDHPGLDVLVATGWRDICTKFHRSCPATADICTRSNQHLMEQLDHPGKVVVEKCDNGLVDCATPIIVRGKHIASLATGQMLLEEPDVERFRRQAHEFGFGEQEYLEALREIPVVTEENLKDVTSFLGEMALIISELGYTTLQVKEDAARLESEIAERKRVEELLRESEQKFRELAEALPETVFEMDRDGRLTFVNRKAYEYFGRSEGEFKQGLRGVDMLVPEDRELAMKNMRRSMDGDSLGLTEYMAQRKDGTTFPVLLHSTPIVREEGVVGLRGFIIDITEKKRLEAQLVHAKKMEAIGALAGGVAHDLNNILTGIVSYPDLLLMQMPKDSPLRQPIRIMKETGRKAAAIVQDLLTLARRGVAVTDVVDLNAVVTTYLSSPEFKTLRSFHPNVEVEQRLEANLLHIMGSPFHLAKTLMNLIANAAEAMPAGGRIVITTENRQVDRPIAGYCDVKEGDYIVLTVADSGRGMSQEEQERIFEPFYTKKTMGKSGTGLGMTVVWGTVKDHDGYVDVESTEGRGTTFTLYFPVARKELTKDVVLPASEEYQGTGERILVVDDVPNQREIATLILSHLGYRVTAVASGEEAVEYLKEDSVDLLVLDMIMDPGMDGFDTYKKILEAHPGHKAIVVSGFSETGRVKEAQALGAGQYVKKPYTLKEIGIAVRNELDR